MKALGLDLGTTSLSAVVLETDSGVLAAKTVQNAAFLMRIGAGQLTF